jgi:hypothetical protein
VVHCGIQTRTQLAGTLQMNNLNSNILHYFCVKFQRCDKHRHILGQALRAVYKLVHFLPSHSIIHNIKSFIVIPIPFEHLYKTVHTELKYFNFLAPYLMSVYVCWYKRQKILYMHPRLTLQR